MTKSDKTKLGTRVNDHIDSENLPRVPFFLLAELKGLTKSRELKCKVEDIVSRHSN